jgi:hypothetical protein
MLKRSQNNLQHHLRKKNKKARNTKANVPTSNPINHLTIHLII